MGRAFSPLSSILLLLLMLVLMHSPAFAGSKRNKVTRAERRERKKGCILKFYPKNPKEAWPTTASSDGVYRLAVVIRNRKRGSLYKNVYFSFQKPATASWAGEPRAKPALPGATLIPPFLPSAWWLYGPFNVSGGRRQYVEIAYTLSACSPGIIWNVTTSIVPVPPFFQRPPSEALPATCLAYAYGRQYAGKTPCV
ncbi:hypothetical protein NGA_0476301 [Nannochloropsis gaditana CCMP526]|uniref:uncharacterized protein n=1 Tax=Nannochloropsis gaditana (strain CCMP526) TaxID=1093141 RepID=UPI00029F6ABA|nr:hypothetical protein NGA_0476301 [Nannochloropsis gaditana CCMP526]EKU22607.1 hypothetical protein NGA_0476301 [Nannochloropsis gaditana CCMP526]|eukprot:XP_005853755.1 hypothetical protein NGA_0476301 [Nannochloropsis gaditana CCMP526]